MTDSFTARRVTDLPLARPAVLVWRPAPMASVQGSLALDLQPRLDPPDLDHVAGVVGGDVVPIGAPHRQRLEQWARRHLQATVEIVSCDRPASQLVRWCTPRVYDDLVRRAQLVAQAGEYRPGLGRGPGVVRPQVQGVHTCFLRHEVAEVSVLVRYGERFRALAARYEVIDGHWLCSALDFS